MSVSGWWVDVWARCGLSVERLLPPLAQTLYSCDCLLLMESQGARSQGTRSQICAWNNTAPGLEIRLDTTPKLFLQVQRVSV